MSVRELAAALSAHLGETVDEKYVAKLERGVIRWPSSDRRRALRTILNAPNDNDLGFHITRSAAGRSSGACSGSEVVVVGRLIVGDEEIRLRASAALEDARRCLDQSVVAHLGQQLCRCKTADGELGPAVALPIVLGIIGAISECARDVEPGVRGTLLSLAAEGAEFAGWLYRDLQMLYHATFWYDRAMEWAQEATDTTMQGYVLVKKSQMAYDYRDAHRVMTLANAAVEGPWQLTGRVRSEALLQAALGMALTGASMLHVERTLDEAHRQLEAASANGDPQNGDRPSFTADTFKLRQAACYTEAGKPASAAALFGDVIAAGRLSRRDAGFFGARRAAALALSGEPDEAADVGMHALQLAATTNSERTKLVLRGVVRALEPWGRRPGPRQLREALSPRS